jgi:hypothetical protein
MIGRGAAGRGVAAERDQTFGRLTVLERVGQKWLCRCSCGNEKLVSSRNLRSGNTSSCGCIRLLDLSGQTFGRLTAVRRLGGKRWLCRCTCGNEKEVSTGNLRAGHVTSCGCLQHKVDYRPLKHIDLSGLRTGKLVAIERDMSKSWVWWVCRCDCGKTTSVRAADLTRQGKRGPQQSCGCAQGKQVPDLLGRRFGKLVVLERVGSAPLKKGGGALWSCACDCGKTTRATTARLIGRDRPKKSCGCLRNRTVDLVGQRFGRLVVVKRAGTLRGAQWKCRCDCGVTVLACSGDLRKGRPRSCGCLITKPSTPPQTWSHFSGTIASPEYVSWQAMRARCADTNHPRYGGRGISVYRAWIDNFDAFFEHVGPRPSPDHSLDRINNDGDYEPGNVRWATRKEQAANRSTTKVDAWDKKFMSLWFRRGYNTKDVAKAFRIGRGYASKLKRQLLGGEQR